MNKTIQGWIGGFILGIGLTLALGAANNSNSNGRFQITSAANYMAVLDTETGQVWAGNFNQLGPGAAGLEFRNCPQAGSDFFSIKPR